MKYLKKYKMFESAKEEEAVAELTDMLVSWVFDDAEIGTEDWEYETMYTGRNYEQKTKVIRVNIGLSKYKEIYENLAVHIAQSIRSATGMSMCIHFYHGGERLEISLSDDVITTSDLIADLGLDYEIKEHNSIPYLTAKADRAQAIAALEYLKSKGCYDESRSFVELYDKLAEKSGVRQIPIGIEIERLIISDRYGKKIKFSFDSKELGFMNTVKSITGVTNPPAFTIDSSSTLSPYVYTRLSGASWDNREVSNYLKLLSK